MVIFHFFSSSPPKFPSLQSGPTTWQGEIFKNSHEFAVVYLFWFILSDEKSINIRPTFRSSPDYWAKLPGDEACGGKNQSPIDLRFESLLIFELETYPENLISQSISVMT